MAIIVSYKSKNSAIIMLNSALIDVPSPRMRTSTLTNVELNILNANYLRK